jgi:formamidopyrimidine-DNA glycosylase
VPELPDIELYVHHVARRTVGETLACVRVGNPFLVRSFEPKLESVHGKKVVSVERIAKRVVMGFEGDLFLVFHLMIAGRFRWKERGAPVPKKVGLAAFDFPKGTLVLTEAGTKRRASLYVVRGREGLKAHDPGGVDPMTCDLRAFRAALLRESHTLKRALTDPRAFSGIGNAYSDEILHAARLSPVKLVGKLDDAEIARLFESTRETLGRWAKKLKDEAGDEFPEKVTAFREGMSVHGRFGKPCPVCGAPVQRIVHAENEANYCARCQTGGKLLADRALSRLLKGDWPRSLDELEERPGFARQKG